jgi:hypothetical protein
LETTAGGNPLPRQSTKLGAHQELWQSLADLVECEAILDGDRPDDVGADDLEQLALSIATHGSLGRGDALRVADALRDLAALRRTHRNQ